MCEFEVNVAQQLAIEHKKPLIVIKLGIIDDNQISIPPFMKYITTKSRVLTMA